MKVKLEIGDPSGDGHKQHETFIFESNKTVQEIRKAYKDSCKLTGLSFNHNQDFTGLNLAWNHPEHDDRQIYVEYESTGISRLAEEILLKHGIDVWKGYDEDIDHEEECEIDGADHFVELWTKFVQLSLPDLILTQITDNSIPCINEEDLNVQFGYGLYD